MQQSFQIKVLIAHSDPLLSAGLSAALSMRTDFKVAVYDPERGARRIAQRTMQEALTRREEEILALITLAQGNRHR
jgi:hypothetical protein